MLKLEGEFISISMPSSFDMSIYRPKFRHKDSKTWQIGTPKFPDVAPLCK